MAEPLHVLVAGAGVAGVEALLALRDLGRDRVRLTLLAPGDEWVSPPLAVGEPFGAAHAGRYPLGDLVARTGARHVRGALESVDVAGHRVRTDRGEELAYDALVLGLGADPQPAFERATTFNPFAPDAVAGLLRDIEEGYVHKLAILVPAEPHWPLPAYELALLTRRQATGMGQDHVEITVVTAEDAPLGLFGPRSSEAVAEELEAAGVRVESAAHVELSPGRATTVALGPGGRSFDVDRVLALPRLQPRAVAGVPADEDGFLAVDEHSRVRGADDVYAAGDGTDFPVKMGGIAAAQADAAAHHIAHRAGARDGEPEPFHPILRGMLMGGEQTRWMRRDLDTPPEHEAVADHALWWPPGKIAGRYIAPYVAALEKAGAQRAAT
ncbi:MAG: FAD-dependent oxidoreductase [Solirubrobacterales bacterium]|nr:FAD-dependent oxidoreductase [Solirubrobacterales bacterium]